MRELTAETAVLRAGPPVAKVTLESDLVAYVRRLGGDELPELLAALDAPKGQRPFAMARLCACSRTGEPVELPENIPPGWALLMFEKAAQVNGLGGVLGGDSPKPEPDAESPSSPSVSGEPISMPSPQSIVRAS